VRGGGRDDLRFDEARHEHDERRSRDHEQETTRENEPRKGTLGHAGTVTSCSFGRG
jgi:hypothetical protein